MCIKYSHIPFDRQRSLVAIVPVTSNDDYIKSDDKRVSGIRRSGDLPLPSTFLPDSYLPMRHVQQLPRTGLIGQHKRRIAKRREHFMIAGTSLIESNGKSNRSTIIFNFNIRMFHIYSETKSKRKFVSSNNITSLVTVLQIYITLAIRKETKTFFVFSASVNRA